MTNKIPGRCSGRFRSRTDSYSFSGLKSSPCQNAGKVVEDGKLWCNIHKPSKRKAQQDAQDARWADRRDKEVADRRAIAYFPELLAAAIDLYYNMGEINNPLWEEFRLAIAKAKGESDPSPQSR